MLRPTKLPPDEAAALQAAWLEFKLAEARFNTLALMLANRHGRMVDPHRGELTEPLPEEPAK